MTRTLRVFMAGILGLFCGGRQCEAQSEIALVDGPGWESPSQNYLAVGGLGSWSTESGAALTSELGFPVPAARSDGRATPRPAEMVHSSAAATSAAAPVTAAPVSRYPIRDHRDWYLLAIVGLTFAAGCATTTMFWWRRRHQPRWTLTDLAH